MSVYLLVDILTVIFPLLFSFEKRIRYFRRFRPLFISILVTGTVFLVWDVMATARGDWAFNGRYILGPKLWGIPLEEILFFVVVPYSCLFIYEVLAWVLPDKKIDLHINLYVVSAVCLGLAWFNRFHAYTATVLVMAGIVTGAVLVTKKEIFYSRNFWAFMAISYVPFLVVNYVLTSLPVVMYSPFAIMGKRFLTIPYEDFLYSYTMLLTNFWIYQQKR